MKLNFSRKGFIFSIIGIMIIYTIIVILSDFDKLTTAIISMKIELIPIILGIQFISFFLRSLRQKEFFHQINIHLSMKKNFVIFLSGLSMLMTPGGLGSGIKLQFLKNEFGHQRRKTLPIVLYERYHDFLAIISIMIVISFFFSLFVSNILIIVSSIIIFTVSIIIKHEKIAKLFLDKFGKLKPIKKFLDSTEEMHDSLTALMSLRPLIIGWSISITAVILDLIAVYLIFSALDIELEFIVTSQLFLTSIIAGVFSLLPAGIGVTEGSLLGLLASHGLEFSLASAAVLIVRGLTLWFSTIVGFITIKFIKRLFC